MLGSFFMPYMQRYPQLQQYWNRLRQRGNIPGTGGIKAPPGSQLGIPADLRRAWVDLHTRLRQVSDPTQRDVILRQFFQQYPQLRQYWGRRLYQVVTPEPVNPQYMPQNTDQNMDQNNVGWPFPPGVSDWSDFWRWLMMQQMLYPYDISQYGHGIPVRGGYPPQQSKFAGDYATRRRLPGLGTTTGVLL